MPKRVNRLTDEQRARMPAWRDKWIAIGLRTERADRAKFEAAVVRCYAAAKLAAPKRIVWVQSPFVLALAAPIAAYLLKKDGAVGGAVRDAVRDAVDGAVDDAVDGAVDGAVRNAVYNAVDGAVDGAVRGAVRDAVRDAVYNAVDGAVRNAVYNAVDGAVDGAVRGAVRDAVRDAVYNAVDGAVDGAVGDAVGGAVGDAVGDAVRDAVYNAVGDYIRSNYYRYIGGQFWVGGWWGSPAYISFMRDVCRLELQPDIAYAAQAYQDTAESACWWWPHTDFVMACERPTQINRDAQGRLHSVTGPAIVWPDGWGIHSWHGTTVPREWIEQSQKPEAPTHLLGVEIEAYLAEQEALYQERLSKLAVAILTHSNVEQRRAGAEIVGWKNILAKLQPRVIDRDHDPQIGILLEVDLPDAPNERFLQVRCGTGREFVLPVPREYNTALEANAATYNVPPQLLRQIEVRT